MIQTVHSQLPKLLGYIWEGGFSTHDEPVMVMDALGRVVPIPYLVCTSKKVCLRLQYICRHLYIHLPLELPQHARVDVPRTAKSSNGYRWKISS
jgi:hypothetical protein